MKPFTSAHRFNAVFQWCSANAQGECSVLVDLPMLGVAVYVYIPRGPLFRRLNGPAFK